MGEIPNHQQCDEAALHFESLRILATVEGGVLRTHEVGCGLGAEMRVATSVDAGSAERAIVERLARL